MGKNIVRAILRDYNENQLIFASQLFREKLIGKISEAAFYKVLERMCKEEEIVKLAKGTYYLPKKTKYGIIPPSEKEILSAFTSNCSGTVIGYTLYNNLSLTTQIPKTINVMSSALESFSKTIRNINIQYLNISYTEEVNNMIHGLEVLQNFNKIQDINYISFIKFAENFAYNYNENIVNKIIETKRYKKVTISFLYEILKHFNVNNNLNVYLSELSNYKHPTMEEIYEVARV